MKIEVLYPEICSLYGDLMNAEYLARACDAELIKTSLKAEPRFVSEEIAFVYMGCTTEKGQTLTCEALGKYRDALEKRVENGGLLLATGNALEIFGEYIQNEDGTHEEMLGLFPTHAERHMMNRYNSLYLGKLDDIDVVGFKSQFGHSYGDNGSGFLTTVRGAGLNPDTVPEGLRRNNLFATYLLGPLLILNPPLCKYFLRLMGVDEPVLPFEDAAMDVYHTRLAEFKEPDRGFLY